MMEVEYHSLKTVCPKEWKAMIAKNTIDFTQFSKHISKFGKLEYCNPAALIMAFMCVNTAAPLVRQRPLFNMENFMLVLDWFIPKLAAAPSGSKLGASDLVKYMTRWETIFVEQK